MKSAQKILSLILAFTLLLSTAGIVHFAHYCNDNFQACSFGTPPPCCCGDVDTADDCCKNEVTVFQLTNDCVSAEKASIVKPSVAPSFLYLTVISTSTSRFVTAILPGTLDLRHKSHNPPLYLTNRILLI